MRFSIFVPALICSVILPGMSQTPTVIRKQYGPLTAEKFASIPDFVLPAAYKDRSAHPLPASVDNSKQKYMPPIYSWGIDGFACAHAASVSYAFTYEEQMAQNLSTSGNDPKYTYEYTYHFLNSGDESQGGDGLMFVEAFDILKATGGMTTTDFGGLTWGSKFGGWPSGYAKYYNAMKSRASEYYKIDASVAGGDELIKQYLYDHADGSAAGGILVFQMNSDNIDKYLTTVSGKNVITKMDNQGGHALNIVGYDDNFNGGSYLLGNSWGDPKALFWAKYSLFKAGGLATAQGTPVMFVNVRKNYTPQLTLKVSISHSQRNQIAIMTGAAGSAAATAPTKTQDYAGAFNYAGGPFPLGGIGQSQTIEIGLDLTDFAPILTGNDARFFLHVLSKGGTGTINSVTLMDYTSGTPKEIAATETNKAIASGATTTISIPWTGKVVSAVRAAATARASGANCFAEPSLAHRSGNPVRITLTGFTGFAGLAGTDALAKLTIRDISGRPVFSNSLSLGTLGASAAGPVSMSWEMKDGRGMRVAPGIYYASIEIVDGNGIAKSAQPVKSGATKINIID